jgi:D-glycero-alpha-D-manno-heptose-7-phosphate kinase
MIISKTPLRMSFVGGGSDMPSFYREYGGAVLSSAINAFVYIIIKEKFDEGIRLSYSETENVLKASDIQHPIFRNALKFSNFKEPVEIISIADIPSSGTGLGSSSSFTVGLLKALNKFKNIDFERKKLAELACDIEINLCGSPIGKQDQYAAVFGGLRIYKFNKDDSVDIEKIEISSDVSYSLNNEIISFYIGGNRNTNDILADQQKQLVNKDKINAMKRMVDLVFELKKVLENNNLDSFGEILHENWNLKKEMTKNIANTRINEIYKIAMDNGAKGGKLLGAGGGGFMIFHVPSPDDRIKIEKKLGNLRRVNLSTYKNGSEILDYK